VRLLLGIPTGGSPAAPFLDSLNRLELPPNADAFERAVITGNFVPAQRDVILERALRWNADVVVMCDDDMVLPSDSLRRLCKVLDADSGVAAIGALYYSRDGLRPMVVDGWDAGDSTKGWIPGFDDRTPVAVDGVGFGCIAIRTEGLRDLARPFFASHVYVEPGAGRVRVCDEDYLFCARLRAGGRQVLLHPGVRCGHYDRGRKTTAPTAWESVRVSSAPRVLVQSGEAFRLVPLAEAPPATSTERRTRADVVYIEADEDS
jgi:hypothetical protein